MVRGATCALFIAVGILAASGAARADTVSQEDWLRSFRVQFPHTICTAYPNVFMTPYGVSQDDCKRMILKTLDFCLELNRELLPPVLNQPDDGQFWGQKFGECSGSVYGAVMKPRLPAKRS